MSSHPAGELLNSQEVSALLRVHRKQVYRLMRRGLPAHRVGGEWRFVRGEILAWVEKRDPATGPTPLPAPEGATAEAAPPPLLAANGDVAVQLLLAGLEAAGPPLLGFVLADKTRALAHLQAGAALLAGCHGDGFPGRLGGERLARIHLVAREVGLATPAEKPLRSLKELTRRTLAGRPATAGVYTHLTTALRAAGIELRAIQKKTRLFDSHREVVCAVARGDAEAGLTTRAWAWRLGLGFFPLATEPYGLLVKARDLGDRRVVRLCEVAQGAAYQKQLEGVPGYNPRGAGDIRYDTEEERPAPAPR
jgi:putative molybdopterin biosynthesis protein